MHLAPEGLEEGGDAVVDVGARLARRGPPEEARVAPLVLALRLLALEGAAELALAQPRVLLTAKDAHAGGCQAGEHCVRCLPRSLVGGDEAEDRARADLCC